MRICCTMIVKNEAHVIRRCLESVLPLVDCVCICDTGSTDETKDVFIQTLCASSEPVIWRRRDNEPAGPGLWAPCKWVNFGHNRTEAFRIAEGEFDLGPDDWHLVIDADDVLELADLAEARKQIAEQVDAHCLMVRVLHANIDHWRPQFFRADGYWEYRGPLHEGAYRTAGQPDPVKGSIHLALRYRVIGGGARSLISQEAKFAADVATLEAHLADHPEDARSQFYLAQSLRDAGRIPEAIQAYLKRASMRGWDQEKYYALLQAGRLKQLPGQDRSNIRDVFLHAFKLDPTRAEAPFELARYMTEAPDCIIGTMAEGAAWAEIAARSPEPSKGALFAEPQVWHWSKALAAGLRARWL